MLGQTTLDALIDELEVQKQIERGRGHNEDAEPDADAALPAETWMTPPKIRLITNAPT